MAAWLHYFGPVVEYYIMVEYSRRGLFTLWHLRSKERDRKGQSPNISFWGMPPVAQLPSTILCLLKVSPPSNSRKATKPSMHGYFRDHSWSKLLKSSKKGILLRCWMKDKHGQVKLNSLQTLVVCQLFAWTLYSDKHDPSSSGPISTTSNGNRNRKDSLREPKEIAEGGCDSKWQGIPTTNTCSG
jgi:hypothetical protein